MIKNPMLIDLPLPIYTERLLLRPAMPGDGNEIFAAVEESREELKNWLFWTDNVKNWQDSEKTVREFYSDLILRKAFNFVIIYSDTIIGLCSFHDINWKIPSASIGYWLKTLAVGKGFMQEAITALVLYGFNQIGFKRQTIICDDNNIRSKKLAEKLGFHLEIKALGLIENQLSDELAMGCMYAKFNLGGLSEEDIRW